MSFNMLTILTIFLEMLFLDIMAGAFFQETPSFPRVRLKAVGFITASAVQVVNVFLFHHTFSLKVLFAFLIDYIYPWILSGKGVRLPWLHYVLLFRNDRH